MYVNTLGNNTGWGWWGQGTALGHSLGSKKRASGGWGGVSRTRP